MKVIKTTVHCVVHVKSDKDEDIDLERAAAVALESATKTTGKAWIIQDTVRRNYDHAVVYLEEA